MLHLVEFLAPIELTAADLRSAVRAIDDQQWRPAGCSSEQHFFELAGANPDDRDLASSPARQYAMMFDGIEEEAWGDVFFREDGFFFVTNAASGAGGQLTVSGLGRDRAQIEAATKELIELVQNAITNTMDGRRTRHMRFDWETRAPRAMFAALIAQLQKRGAEPEFKEAELDEKEVAASRVLSDKNSRELLKDLRIARFARTSDILANRGKQHKSAEGALQRLAETGLIVAEHTLQCRKTSAPLSKITCEEDLNGVIGELRCANCDRLFKEELLVEGYRPTTLGTTLSQGSQWMTILTTDSLVKAGAPLENIRWNLEESGDEIDILVDFMDQLWVFELKDREFGPGDAHPFNYRRARYRASQSVVVTTEKVSPQAKAVFADAVEQGVRPRRAGRRPDEPMYIEGLDRLDDALDRAFASAAMALALRRVRAIPLPVNVNLGRIVRERFA